MQNAELSVHPRPWRYVATALACLLPLAACLALTWMGARQLNLNQAQTEANITRNQTERILREAWLAIDAMGPLLQETCADAQPVLSRTASMRPYFRSLLLLKGQQPYCSSAIALPSKLVDWPWDIPPGRWLRVAPGTPLMQERPALVAGASGPENRHALAVIDGQYLQDLVDSVAALNNHRIVLQVDGGIALASRPARDSAFVPRDYLNPIAKVSFMSEGVPISISVALPSSEFQEEWQGLLLVFLPVALVIGLMMAWAVHRMQTQRMSFHDQIRRAIRAGEFHMEYQPMYATHSGHCEGAEALMRWERPGIGRINPEVFIAAAEAEGVIVPLTRHALRLIERDLPAMGLPPGFHLSVNVAAEHIMRDDFADDIDAFVTEVAASAPALTLELTERSLVEDSGRVQRTIARLRASGVQVAIDDFGAGYCSLSYLQQFPVDYLKIDKAFIDAIVDAEQESPILDLVLALAQRLGLAVVAEGVSTQSQMDYMLAHDVAYVQGYLIAGSMRAADFAQWYQERGRNPLS